MSSDVGPDVLAFVFALVGGVSMGSYPVAIKAPSVLRANMHPMIFQCYKSFWVFVLGFAFILLNLVRSKPAFVFTYWGLLGAAAWIPSGLGTIAAVPRLGVGMAVVVTTGTSAILQFLVGQMVGESMRRHGPPGHEYVRAPYFLVGVVIGMVGLVLSPIFACPRRNPVSDATVSLQDGGEAPQEAGSNNRTGSKADVIVGLFFAFVAGFFSAVQFGVIAVGKKVESSRFHCDPCPEKDHFVNEFDAFGSYMTSFGIGAGMMTACFFSFFAVSEKCQGKDKPESHFRILRVWGSVAGCCWVVGNVFLSAAVSRGGDSVMGPASQAIQLTCSGAWGLLYFREVKDPRRIACWLLSAVWTFAFLILLGREKSS